MSDDRDEGLDPTEASPREEPSETHRTEPIELPEPDPTVPFGSTTRPSRPAPPADVPGLEEPDVVEPDPQPEPPPEPERRVELPPLEEITFEPRDEAPPAVTAPRRPAPEPEPTPVAPRPALERPDVVVPRTLSRKRMATLVAFADALIPQGGTLPPAASECGVPQRIDAALATFDAGTRASIERALRVVEWAGIASRSLRPFSRMQGRARTALVARLRRSRLRPVERAADLLAWFCLNQWAATPAVEGAVGFTYACVTDEPPRDGARLEVVRYPQIARDHTEECDVVVVGAGAGGSVVAKELAELGHTVVVLEEGSPFTRADLGGPPFERMHKLFRGQGATSAAGRPPVALPLGRGLGGTTLVSAGTAMRVPDDVLVSWEKRLGLPEIDPGSMRPFFERVERNQSVRPTPESLLGPNAEVFRRGVDKLGVHAGLVQRQIEGCRGCGVCSYGCPSDAKLSTHLTYLPRAQRAGASIYANVRAHRIVIADGRARGVVAAVLDPRTREAKATLTVRAKVVVLAAGAIHTPALLSDNALGNRSGLLGRGLRVGPRATVGAFFDEPIHAWRGTMQPFAVDEWLSSHDTLIEVTAPVPSAVAGDFPGAGLELKEMVARFPHYATAHVVVADSSTGAVARRRGGEPQVSYALNEADARRLVRGILNTAEIFLAAGAHAVVTGLPGFDGAGVPKAFDEGSVKPSLLRLSGWYPSGTAGMGADPATSVVDAWGEVHGVPGLFVADASVLPGSATVPPQITVMALATRTADHLARHAARFF